MSEKPVSFYVEKVTSRSVLVVDDDPQIQELIKYFLEKENMIVHVCGDGFTALDLLQTQRFDLMILDISMPGMDGFKTLSLIRKNPATANLRVLMLTSNKHANDVIKATQYGVSDYIIKPSVREEILKRVERALERW